jgi:hypothetical protein
MTQRTQISQKDERIRPTDYPLFLCGICEICVGFWSNPDVDSGAKARERLSVPGSAPGLECSLHRDSPR